MKHNKSMCQYPFTKDPNTPKFWNKKIEQNLDQLLHSSIYIDKNRYVFNAIKKTKGKLLDVGIGYGVIEKKIVDNKLKFSLYGIDISDLAIQQARRRFVGKFRRASITSIPYKANSFDCVLALDVIEHLTAYNAKKALHEINRVTKKGGLLVLSVPTNELEDDRINNGHLCEYTIDIVNKLIVGGGFNIQKIKTLVAFNRFYNIKNIINRSLKIKKPNLIIVVATKN